MASFQDHKSHWVIQHQMNIFHIRELNGEKSIWGQSNDASEELEGLGESELRLKIREGTVKIAFTFPQDPPLPASVAEARGLDPTELVTKYFPTEALGKHKHIDLSISFLDHGIFRSFTLSKQNCEVFIENDGEDSESEEEIEDEDEVEKTHFFLWEIQYISTQLQILMLDTDISTINYAISGYRYESMPTDTDQQRSAITEIERPLQTIATLLKSPRSDFVFLASAAPSGDVRRLRAHRRLLCDSSSYFKALLQSEFAEGSALKEHDQQKAEVEAEERSSSDAQLDLKKGGPLPDETSALESIPIVFLSEASHSQLQSILFYIYTGRAVIAQRPGNVFTKQRGEQSHGEREVPWWDGILQPANAFEVYGIADKYDIAGLRAAALRHIAAHLEISRFDELWAHIVENQEITLYLEIKAVYKKFCEDYKHQIKKSCIEHENVFRKLGIDDEDKDKGKEEARTKRRRLG